jgi:hypothetical protein
LKYYTFKNTTQVIIFWWDWNLSSVLRSCKTGTLPLVPQLQFILLCLFWRWGLKNYFPELAWNCDPPNLTLPSSWIRGMSQQCLTQSGFLTYLLRIGKYGVGGMVQVTEYCLVSTRPQL